MAKPDLLSRIAKRVAATARWVRGVSIGVKIILVFGGGALSGAAKLLPVAKAGEVPWQGILGWLGVAFVFIGGVALLLLDRDQSAALADAAEAIEAAHVDRLQSAKVRSERDQAEDLVFRQARLVAVATALREAAEEVLLGGPGDGVARRARLERVLDILASQKTTLFDMADERWNFAIYLHDEGRGVLTCAACSRPTRAEGDAPHRDIAPGAGHVGKVFISGREAVADDSMKAEYRDMFEMPTEQGGKPDDAMVYRSIASVPIRLGRRPLFGVLVATSDEAGRFWPRALQAERAGFDTVEPLRVCAGTLAIVLEVSNLLETLKGQ